MKKIFLFSFMFLSGVALMAQIPTVKITAHLDKATTKIDKEVYGQFAEDLGNGIYGGIWVGKKSKIPNVDGYRKDVFNALKALHIPVLRWPGGCFADEYHWMDGIGPQSKRPKIYNANWGGVVEDNSFGTNEFLNLCEMLGCEPYISGNVGSGTVEELDKWVEYMTSDGDNPMANLRRQNGRDKPWKVKFLGVGNESWGCGGNMRPEYYSDLFRRYSTYCRNYGDNKLYKIASGASDYDYNWTKVLMKDVGHRMNGLSLHYYTIKSWTDKGSATHFDKADYLRTMAKCLDIANVIKKHSAIMDKYDPQKKIGLIVDEWGTWWNEEPGSHPGFLRQQNTLRDAFVAALTLNIFNKHTDRIKMANIAQMVNVLQAMILTDSTGIVLTPTYYVFKMYEGHMGATYIPMDISCSDTLSWQNKKFPAISVSASKAKDGNVLITLANIDPDKGQEVQVAMDGLHASAVEGTILTAKELNAHNTFAKPDEVKPAVFKGVKLTHNGLIVKMPAKSIVAITLKK